MMNEEYLLRRPDYETDNFLFYIRLFCILPVSETEILFTNIHISPLICQHMILLNKERIARTLKRISMQIAEETKGSHIHLIGMNKRGFILATILQEHLSEILHTTPELLDLLDGLPDDADPIPAPEQPTALIFVDDVIFSGGTI